MKKQISIIVPVYNVDKYLSECIDSILNQTYEYFEVLLIDDGSTDNSSKICKEYALKDDRIFYYKKNNGGLSDARNYGLDRANGDYITFIDSDDYIEKDYLELLYNSIELYNADISIANYQRVDEFGRISFDILPGDNMVLDSIDAMKYVLYQKYISISVTAKLYKKSIFTNIRFPVGKLYEDIITLPKLIFSSQKIVYISNVLLNYRIRSGSITESKFKDKDMDMIENATELLNFIEKNNIIELCKPAESYVFSKSSTLLFLINRSANINSRKYSNLVWQYIKKYRCSVLLDKNARKLNRIASLVSFFGCKLYIFVYQKFKKER